MNRKQKKKKRQSSYHIVILPEDSSQVHRLRVRPWHYRGGFVLTIALLLGLAVSAGGYLRYHGLYKRTADMRARYSIVQQEQARLAEKLVQLEQVVQRAENLASKVGSLVQVARLSGRQGLGPVEEGNYREHVDAIHEVLGRSAGFESLDDLDDNSFANQFSRVMDQLQSRSFTVEKRVTTDYENYQDHLVRLSSTPDIWPVLGWLTSRFGPRRSPITRAARFHEGIDIAAPWGMSVQATGDGVVSFAGYKGGLGNTVAIDHGFGIVTYYGHNSQLHVQKGQKVTRGELIAVVGNTGHSTGPHLHYEVHADGIPVDPMTFLPARTTTASFDRTEREDS